MKFFGREAIYYVNAKDHVRYKYVEQSLEFNYDGELEVNASILGAKEFGEYALVIQMYEKIFFS